MIKSLQKVLPLLVLLLLGFGSMYGQSPQYYNLNNSTGSNAIPLGGGDTLPTNASFCMARACLTAAAQPVRRHTMV